MVDTNSGRAASILAKRGCVVSMRSPMLSSRVLTGFPTHRVAHCLIYLASKLARRCLQHAFLTQQNAVCFPSRLPSDKQVQHKGDVDLLAGAKPAFLGSFLFGLLQNVDPVVGSLLAFGCSRVFSHVVCR